MGFSLIVQTLTLSIANFIEMVPLPINFDLRQYTPRSSELHSLCKIEMYKLWLLKYSGSILYGEYHFKKVRFPA